MYQRPSVSTDRRRYNPYPSRTLLRRIFMAGALTAFIIIEDATLSANHAMGILTWGMQQQVDQIKWDLRNLPV